MERVCEMWTATSSLRPLWRGDEEDGVEGVGELAGEELSLSLSDQEKMVLTEGMKRFGARTKRGRGCRAMREPCKSRISDSETASCQSSTSRNSRSMRPMSWFPKRPVAAAQCPLLRVKSFVYLEARMRAPRKTRWRAHSSASIQR